MAKQQKALERLCANPTPSGFKWNDLVSVLEGLGFRQLNNKGSRSKFFHDDRNVLICCHRPHPSPDVDKGCIEDVVGTLRDNGFI